MTFSFRLGRVFTMMRYEWRRAIARRKVALLLAITVLFEAAPFIILTQLQTPAIRRLLDAIADITWLIGVFAPQGLFIHLMAILIASGSTAEEYEQGTADVLLTKPLTRLDYLVGKYLGGFTLTAFVSLLLLLFGVLLALVTFGPQRHLEYAPTLYATSVYTLLLFYSLAFMLGELYRRSSLALLTAISILITSFVLSGVLFFAHLLTQDVFYLQLNKALPWWSTSNLPQMVADELFLGQRGLPFFQFGPTIRGTIVEAASAIVLYAAPAVAVAALRLLRSDIPRRST